VETIQGNYSRTFILFPGNYLRPPTAGPGPINFIEYPRLKRAAASCDGLRDWFSVREVYDELFRSGFFDVPAGKSNAGSSAMSGGRCAASESYLWLQPIRNFLRGSLSRDQSAGNLNYWALWTASILEGDVLVKYYVAAVPKTTPREIQRPSVDSS